MIISIQSLMKLHYAQTLIDRRKFFKNDFIADLQISGYTHSLMSLSQFSRTKSHVSPRPISFSEM